MKQLFIRVVEGRTAEVWDWAVPAMAREPVVRIILLEHSALVNALDVRTNDNIVSLDQLREGIPSLCCCVLCTGSQSNKHPIQDRI